jgi:hypothetical protein
MKRLILSVVACILQSCATSPEGQKTMFGGLWIAPESEASSFELDLTQNGPRIEGYHAALVKGSGQIEVALPSDGDPPSVTGTTTDRSSARVRFKLRRGKGGGEALLVRKWDKLIWTVTQSEGEALLPQTCTLKRQASAPH